MNVLKLKPEVLGAVRQSLGCEDEDDDSMDDEIAIMDKHDVFDHYLNWNGIIGYSSSIWVAVENIKESAET